MRVLIACEYSGTVRRAFRALGHDAISCDLQPAKDNSPHHRVCDAVRMIVDGAWAHGGTWDLVIAHPPCTHLSSSGAKWWAVKRADGRQQQGIDLFTTIRDACMRHAKAWALENPIGIMSTLWRPADQIVQPWQFGDEARKSTCLWLSNLPCLIPDHIVGHGALHVLPDGRTIPKWYNTKGPHRSVTFPGIARAMAEQWGGAVV